MKYIIKNGNYEEEFQGTPSEIIELKSNLDGKEELRKAIKIAVENNDKKVTETLVGEEKIEREI